MNKSRILITGGAGFIGSNLVEDLINDDRVDLIRVLDNLSTGSLNNIEPFLNSSKVEFINGDITDYSTCLKACDKIDKILHQAALGSVPRSVNDPVHSTAVKCNVERVISAFSSSTYGDNLSLPKKEDFIGNPLSPYAITKVCNEMYARVFGEIYNLKWIGLRYFNVFGPKQNPEGPYAAVIPIFIKSAINNEKITINGDGETSRDFTFIKNIVELNKLALFTENKKAFNKVYNGACGGNISLNELTKKIKKLNKGIIKVTHGPERKGDVRHSLASIEKAVSLLNYNPIVTFDEGLKLTFDFIKKGEKL